MELAWILLSFHNSCHESGQLFTCYALSCEFISILLHTVFLFEHRNFICILIASRSIVDPNESIVFVSGCICLFFKQGYFHHNFVLFTDFVISIFINFLFHVVSSLPLLFYGENTAI